MQKFSLLLTFLILSILFAHAETIHGKISDKKTGELLVGCTVYLEGSNLGTTTGLDGSFNLKNIKPGSYILVCSYISYQSYHQEISVKTGENIDCNIQLEPENTDLNEVMVLGHIDKSTETSARSSEKNTANIINVMSAKAIELSPDLNVGSVIQRMSGVTIERNSSGEAQYAILRGMDKRYNYTLVNGVKIPSPDNKQRYVPLNIFPSELLDRVEVTKSLTSEMEGDATGGVVDMIMKDAPSKFMVQANVALGYNARFFNKSMVLYPVENIMLKSPREKYGPNYEATVDDFNNQSGKLVTTKTPLPNGTAGFSVGNRFMGQRLGFIVAANYQNFNKGHSGLFYDDEMIQTESTVRITDQKTREYSENEIQYGVHSKIDFRFSHRNNIEWYNAYFNSQTAQVRQSTSLSFSLNYDPDNGDEDLAYQTRIRTERQSIFASTLQGVHLFIYDRLALDWSLVYSKAKNRLPENTEINLDNLVQNFVDNIYADTDGSTRRWEYNNDRDYTAHLKLKYNLELAGAKMVLKAGGMYRNKQRGNHYVNYRFKPLNGSQYYGTDFTTLDEIQWTLYTPSGSVGPLEYDASEKIAAEYVNADWTKGNFYVSIGLRGEYTDQGYYMYFPNAGDDNDGGQTYYDLLPSAQFKYSPTEKTNWKASYFRSLNRPGFFEIVPYQIVNEEYNEYGNEDLKRAVIDNVDLRWEYFPKQKEQVMVGLFFKNIKNPIEYAYFTQNYRQYGYGPMNFGTAKNFGAEIDYIKFIRNFGIKANYTFTHSSITTSKAYYGTDEDGNYKRFFADQTRPLVGQAQHVANLSLMYKSTRHGWDAQLAGAYTGEKIAIASHYLGSDYWDSPMFNLDASAEKRFKNGFSIFAKVNNILNQPSRQYIKTHNDYNDKFPILSIKHDYTLIRENNYNTTFLLGLRYKL